MGLTSRGRIARGLGLLALLGGGACSTTPPPAGLEVVSPEPTPPEPEEVARAQRALRAQEAYLGPIDGRLTAETRVAVARFQRRAGLEVTGTLDAPTIEALFAGAPEAAEEGPPPAPPLPELPSAEALLAPDPERPQPPPGWLEPLLEAVRADLEAEAEVAARLLAEKGVDGVAAAEARLSEARRAGFARIVEARLDGGYAPLPVPLLDSLRDALFERGLLVRPTEGGWGRGEEEAVRWLERSLGLPSTGRPSLPLLEALGIDPAPLFGRGDGFPKQTAIQSEP